MHSHSSRHLCRVMQISCCSTYAGHIIKIEPSLLLACHVIQHICSCVLHVLAVVLNNQSYLIGYRQYFYFLFPRATLALKLNVTRSIDILDVWSDSLSASNTPNLIQSLPRTPSLLSHRCARTTQRNGYPPGPYHRAACANTRSR